MSTAIAFLDTNVLLHYRRIREVDWPAILNAKNVNLVICPCVLQELDKHKETHHSAKIRRRAGEVIAELDLFLDQGASSEIRSGVRLEFVHTEPNIDWSAHKLRPDVPDDRLIAGLIEYGRERSIESALITSDAALKVKAKARQIRTVKLSDDLKLPDEETVEAKRLRETESELRTLKSKLPKLGLFLNGKQSRITFTLPPVLELDTIKINAVMDRIRRENPPLDLGAPPKREPAPPKNPALVKALGLDFNSFKFPNKRELDLRKLIRPEELAKYQSELDDFYDAYRRYLESQLSVKNALRRTVRIDLFVHNDGGSPAEEIVVKLHFPNGFTLCDEEHLIDDPSAPAPPEKPFPFGRSHSIADMMSGIAQFRHSVPALKPPANVSGNSIRKTRSYDVQSSIKKLNHGFHEALDPMFATFPTRDAAKSFSLTYEIHAANLPTPERGELHVVIEKA